MKLAAWRKATGRSRYELAKTLGVAQGTLREIEHGVSACRTNLAKALIDLSRSDPAPNGGAVTLEDLIPPKKRIKLNQ